MSDRGEDELTPDMAAARPLPAPSPRTVFPPPLPAPNDKLQLPPPPQQQQQQQQHHLQNQQERAYLERQRLEYEQKMANLNNLIETEVQRRLEAQLARMRSDGMLDSS